MNRYFAVVDATSTSVTALLAKWEKDQTCSIEGYCRSDSSGLRRGVILDPIKATDSISIALKRLKSDTKHNFHDVYLRVSSTSVNVVPSSGVFLLSKYGREIVHSDIKKVTEIASTIKLPLDQELLHRIVREYPVDGDAGISNPLKLEGVKLGANVNVLTINSAAIRNISKCVSHAGFIPAGFVFSGLASSYRVLSKADMAQGVALVDICRDLSEVMVFNRGSLTDCKVFSAGASLFMANNNAIDLESLDELISQVVSLRGVSNLKKVVVIGEGALLDGLLEYLEEKLGISVVAGTCLSEPSEKLPQDRSQYIGVLGVLDHIVEEHKRFYLGGNICKRVINKVFSFLDRYF